MKISVTKVAGSFVRPSEPTPFETLQLSALDLYPGSRDEYIQSLHVFKQGQQPSKVIKEALSKTLVWYYPLAGRFVDGETTAIECNGEGAWFVEAVAGCTLEDVSYLHHLPLMISESDLFPDARDVPIMMQVTEFRCGGFAVGFTFIHAAIDGAGAAQFAEAIGDFARGNSVPTINPICSRHLIPNPPIGPSLEPFRTFELHSSSFHLPIGYINRIKSIYFRKTGNHCTTFEISTATIWQARTRAINIEDPETPVLLGFFANIRHLLASEVLSQGGYYGNATYPMTITATSGNIVRADLVDIVTMIQDGKKRLPKKFKKWSKGELKYYPWNLPISYNNLYVSDWSNLGFSDVDYGWGKPIYAAPILERGFIIVLLGRPLVPEKGCNLLLQCVTEEHKSALQEHMRALML